MTTALSLVEEAAACHEIVASAACRVLRQDEPVEAERVDSHDAVVNEADDGRVLGDRLPGDEEAHLEDEVPFLPETTQHVQRF